MSPRDGDRREILETVLRYCRAIDRLDWAGVRDCYTADGVDHHTGFDGGADDYVAWLRTKVPGFEGTMHLTGNHLVEFLGDEALVETYANAVHWGSPIEDPRLNFTSGVRYIDRMRPESDGRWRIAERFAVREWTRSDAGRRIAPEAPGPHPARGGQDPLDLLRDRIRGR